jgi:flavin reductase (DIM6/NTAB) family NADH-FMN oxidoreductase RutF
MVQSVDFNKHEIRTPKNTQLKKVTKRPYAALFPCPVVLLTCVDAIGKANIITLAWVGVACSDPPMLSVGVRPQRYSYKLIEDSGEFVVNIPNRNILKQVDYCGAVSGKDVNKFSKTGLTQQSAAKVRAPLIVECPVNMECIVKQKIPLGVHDLFLAEIVCVHVNKDILDEKGNINFAKVSPFVYNQPVYWNLGRRIGTYGFAKRRYK